ncbi:chymotrypsin-like elastase family member 1 [Bradysia coprophila]|uniref:chymotrypsin-like elastase family member 1 n=1 Tax=Bradysia coprophila TaxID=38358 RepID=UPI00187D89DE|nr:chymotrypsin-like elastase family member 1 [Bradysia coprophila]
MCFGYIVVSVLLISLPAHCYDLTENQIKEDIKYLSQTSEGTKPSRLRTLLLADLKRALPTLQDVSNCFSSDDLKVTQNCTCVDYSCERLINHGKRSRIQRSCEDFCCRRSNTVKKSLDYNEFNDVNKHNGCDASNWDSPDGFELPWITQIYLTKSKSPICLGSLIRPNIVITTLQCVSTIPNGNLKTKTRELIDRYQYRYQIRNVTKKIIPENYPQLFEKFGFNIALLVLNKDIEFTNGVRTSCLPQQPFNIANINKCYIESLEYKGGRSLSRREQIFVHPAERCLQRYSQQKRLNAFFPKSNMCAERKDGQDIGISLSGAPLVCSFKTMAGLRYVQYGMLSQATEYNKSPHLFVNLHNFKNWIEKNLSILK